MSVIVSNRSIPATVKTMLLAAVIPLLAVLRAAGVDWGSVDDTERLAREGAVAGVSIASLVLIFALYAHFRKGTDVEPVAVGGGIAAFVPTVFALCFAFDWGSEALLTALLALVTAVLAPVGITIVRNRVWPSENLLANEHVEPADHFYGENGDATVWTIVGVMAAVVLALVLVRMV